MGDRTSSDRFKSCRAHFDRGVQLVIECRTRIEEWWGPKGPFKTQVRVDEVTNEFIALIVCDPPMPRDISSIAIDAIQNFRAALDQAAYAVADPALVVPGKRSPTSFPFGSDEADVRSKNKTPTSPSGAIPADYFEIMVQAKPWRGSNFALEVLQNMRTANEHHTSVFVRGTVPFIVWGPPGTGLGVGIPTGNLSWEPDDGPLEVFRTKDPAELSTAKVPHLELTFGPQAFDKELGKTLAAIEREVKRILDAIEAHARAKGDI